MKKVYWHASVVFTFLMLSVPNAIGSEGAIDKYSTDLNFAQVTFVEAEQYVDGAGAFAQLFVTMIKGGIIMPTHGKFLTRRGTNSAGGCWRIHMMTSSRSLVSSAISKYLII